ncbi:MAG: recombinase family protein [Chloroflexi bacterium]|nr:recombinase family protein [Chloroflexota bacterium]
MVHVYIDEAQSGLSADRPQFQAMRRDAGKGLFDAIVVHRFDRLSRHRTESLAIKSLLRQDYAIKVFSVSESSEDSDGAIGALIEGIMESAADWYSHNVSNETTKGKRERARQALTPARP